MSLAAGKSVSRRKSYRGDPLWIAALVHRVSGLILALFLPLHFLALGLAIEGEARLEGFLRWTDRPLVKLAEAALVLLIAVHLLGGLRVLVIENFSLRQNHRLIVALVAAAAFGLACCFLIRVF